MYDRIKDFYTSTYTDEIARDNLAPNLTFWELLEGMIEGVSVYAMLWTEQIDSVIRENVFRELACRSGLKYQTIYNLRLKGEK